jgi:hypothetical protein
MASTNVVAFSSKWQLATPWDVYSYLCEPQTYQLSLPITSYCSCTWGILAYSNGYSSCIVARFAKCQLAASGKCYPTAMASLHLVAFSGKCQLATPGKYRP